MKNYLIVVDFETGSLNTTDPVPLSIAGKVYKGYTLQPIAESDGGEFYSLMKPPDMDRIEEGALAVNKLKREEIIVAPEEKAVLTSFSEWVRRFMVGKNKPVMCGYNSLHFDNPILEACFLRNNIKNPFHANRHIDLMHLCWLFFDEKPEPANLRLDTIGSFMGLNMAGAHNSLVDVRNTGAILMKFLSYIREISSRSKFKGSFKGEK